MKVIAQNKKARHDYQLIDTFEAGVELLGGEVKSVRAGQISIAEAYVKLRRGEAYLENAYIKPYAAANSNPKDAARSRKLLLHKKEIAKLAGDSQAKSQTVIPLSVYLKNGLVKLEIALSKGKQLHDKRAGLKAKEQKREADRAVRDARR